ncbi:hypothetical protein MTsPCn5_17020 [Croceitalea sp. MTPC5]|nr:hypothetical protein MTsPCn5_17020 [Croceitalea sp. MTPC5]
MKQLSLTYGSPIGALTEAMIRYFKRTGINPKDAINENPSTMIKILDKRIVSFLKVQERDILKPLKDEVYMNSKNQKLELVELTNSLKDVLGKINDADKNRTLLVKGELTKHKDCLIEIASFLDGRGKSGLNQRIKEIFN